MPETYVFPTDYEAREVEQTFMQSLVLDDPILGGDNAVFPIRDVDEDYLVWYQRGNYLGMQQFRGLNGEPPRVARIGANQFVALPGYYGEHSQIDEIDLTTRRRTFGGGSVDVTDLTRELQDQLTIRRIIRTRWICWTLLTTGSYAVLDVKGVLGTSASYTPRVFTASVPWATIATATPLANFTAVKRMSRGYSAAFGAGARAFMNAQTWEWYRSNTNSADVFGRRTQGLGTFNSLSQVNELMQGDDLPRVVVYDDGYLDDTGTFQLFIPNGVVIVVGRRTTGVALGEYRMTRNANNGGNPGVYARIIDHGERLIPRKIEVHNGHNGGPVLFHPEAIVIMQV